MILWMKSYRVTIQMKVTDRYFSEVMFITLYNVVQNKTVRVKNLL